MQIVIDIPEEEYRCIQITGCIGNKTCISNAIYNGTPLPKGHGDLIDRKDLIEDGINKGFCDWYDEIKIADIIIEADKAETEQVGNPDRLEGD